MHSGVSGRSRSFVQALLDSPHAPHMARRFVEPRLVALFNRRRRSGGLQCDVQDGTRARCTRATMTTAMIVSVVMTAPMPTDAGR